MQKFINIALVVLTIFKVVKSTFNTNQDIAYKPNVNIGSKKKWSCSSNEFLGLIMTFLNVAGNAFFLRETMLHF